MIDIEEILNLPKLSLDDSFSFSCNRCGNCCREREDILLSPLDLFKIAKHLGRSVQDIIVEYCEYCEGRDSKLPVVRIKPKSYRRTCPFLKKEGCLIHSVKPAVCAMYPVGRLTESGTQELTYLVQPVTCGSKQKIQTIRQWLSGFSILEEESFTVIWHQKFGEISELLKSLYIKVSFDHISISAMLFTLFYLKYDLEADFMPQFIGNCTEALKCVTLISKEATRFGSKSVKI